MWHTGSESKSDVPCIYEAVVSEVIEGSRELFLEEGCDEIVLDLLKEIWLKNLFDKNAIPNHFMCSIENNNTIHTPNLNANSNSSERRRRRPPKSKSNNEIMKKAQSVTVTKMKYNNPIGVCGRSMPDLNEHLAIHENVNSNQLNKSLPKETESKEITSMHLSKQHNIQPQPMVVVQNKDENISKDVKGNNTIDIKEKSVSSKTTKKHTKQGEFLQTNYKLKRTCLRKPPTSSTPKHRRSKDTTNLQLDLEQSKENSTSNVPVGSNIGTSVQNHAGVLLNSDKLDAHESTLNGKKQTYTETKTSAPGLVPNNIKNNTKVQIGLLDFMEEDLFKSITGSKTVKPVQNNGGLLNPELAIISKKELPNNNVLRNTRECVILKSTSHNIVTITKNIEKGKEYEVCVLPKTILNPKSMEQPHNHNCLVNTKDLQNSISKTTKSMLSIQNSGNVASTTSTNTIGNIKSLSNSMTINQSVQSNLLLNPERLDMNRNATGIKNYANMNLLTSPEQFKETSALKNIPNRNTSTQSIYGNSLSLDIQKVHTDISATSYRQSSGHNRQLNVIEKLLLPCIQIENLQTLPGTFNFETKVLGHPLTAERLNVHDLDSTRTTGNSELINKNKSVPNHERQNSDLLTQAEVYKEKNKGILVSENHPLSTIKHNLINKDDDKASESLTLNTTEHCLNDKKAIAETKVINKDKQLPIPNHGFQNSDLSIPSELFKEKDKDKIEDFSLGIIRSGLNDKKYTTERTLLNKDKSLSITEPGFNNQEVIVTRNRVNTNKIQLPNSSQNSNLLAQAAISKENKDIPASENVPLGTVQHRSNDKKVPTQRNLINKDKVPNSSQNLNLSTQAEVFEKNKYIPALEDLPLSITEYGENDKNQPVLNHECQNLDLLTKNDVSKEKNKDKTSKNLPLSTTEHDLSDKKMITEKNVTSQNSILSTQGQVSKEKNNDKPLTTAKHGLNNQELSNLECQNSDLLTQDEVSKALNDLPLNIEDLCNSKLEEKTVKPSVIVKNENIFDIDSINKPLANQSGKNFVLQDIPNAIFAPEDDDNMELTEETKGWVHTVFTENQNIPLDLRTKNIFSCAINQPMAPKEEAVPSETETLLSSESNNLDFNKQINSKSIRTSMTKSPQSDRLNLKRRTEQPPPFKKIFLGRGTSPILFTVSNKESQLSSVFQDSPEQNESLAHLSEPSPKHHLETGENSAIRNTKKVILKRKSFKEYNILCCSKDVHLPENYCLENQNSVKENRLNDHIDDTISTNVSQQNHEYVKIILPARPGTTTNERTCFIRVPSWLLQEGRFPSILTPLMSKMSNMSTSSAKYFLQRFIDEAHKNIKQECIVIQCDGPANNPKFRLLSKLKNTPVKITKRRVGDTEISSDDDVTDEENPEQVFESDNTIISQFTLVKRTRNKWKIHLKNGVMHIDGKDFFFSSITGTVEF